MKTGLFDIVEMNMSYEQWLAAAKARAGNDWAYFNEWYSFEAAFNNGMTPHGAVADCAAWLEA